MIELAPSLLAADLLNLESEIGDMLSRGVTRLHFDVMDAHFVPNLSFSPELCAAVKARFPECRLDVHLMMDNPGKYLKTFAEAGADILTVHQEVVPDARPTLDAIKALGVKCGLSVKPATLADTLTKYLDMLDNILIMTVEPGFGGQKFMVDMLDKIRLLRAWGYKGDIAVDGGVTLDNARQITDAGANVLVMGTSFFHAQDRDLVVRSVKELS